MRPIATGSAVHSTADRIDTSRPHTARIRNYWLGGRDDRVRTALRQAGRVFTGVSPRRGRPRG
ncbi:SAM-dependent methyltransferase [Streptomyces pratensis]|uniref:SAM-dependent methyltransferase n=1 Tax=Streptomyces pratensis TaxID=1169025 RepID=UPI0037A65A6B